MRELRKQERRNGTVERHMPFGGSWVSYMRWPAVCLLLLLCLMMASCASKEVYLPVAERAALESQRVQEAQTGSNAPSIGSQREGGGVQGGVTEEDILGRVNRGQDGSTGMGSPIRDISFDFDSYVLRKEDLPVLKDLSAWLRASKGKTVAIEGHCDERGSIEYNMALGQKRAEAVREYLLTSGVDGARIKTISYGKETPLDAGHTEEAWAKNRRAHMKIQ